MKKIIILFFITYSLSKISKNIRKRQKKDENLNLVKPKAPLKKKGI